MENTNEFLDRYQNHIQTAGFGVPGQEALARGRILVIGAGHLSSPILSYLTSMGLGCIGIVTEEKVLKKDLPYQPVLYSTQEGKPKGQAIAVQLREINPEVKIKLHELSLNRESILTIIADYDIIIDTANSLNQSLLINDACVISGKPMIYGQLAFPLGYISVFNYKGGSTLRCLMQQEKSIVNQARHQNGLAILAGITGCLMANEAIKIISEIGTVASNKLLSINSLTSQLNSIKIEPIPVNRAINSLRQHYQSDNTQIHSEPSIVRSISPKLLATKIRYKESLQLIDIRESPQKSEENSSNYLNIPAHQLLNELHQMNQDIMVILISEDGERARNLAAELTENHGLDNVYYLEGGMQSWVQETGTTSVTYESF